MNHFDDAKQLVEFCKQTLEKIKKAYNKSLLDKSIKPDLQIEIKNFMENLRSSLDFVSHGLYEKFGDKTIQVKKIHFPYAWLSLDKSGFVSNNLIERNIPGLTIARPDIAAKIESYQHFSNPNNSWLPKFMDLNNENKHQQLTPQTRKETKELRINSGNSGLSLVGNSGIQLRGSNATLRIGNVIISGSQDINPDNPALFYGEGKQEIITWVSFHFSTNDESVLPLLSKSLQGVDKIVSELSSL